MDFIYQYAQYVLHLNVNLPILISQYGLWIYALLFVVIFCETGLFFAPFLPGESLLFAAGSIAATGAIKVNSLAALLAIAAVIGGFINYWLGYTLGKRLLKGDKTTIFHNYIKRTHVFYKKHGAMTIVIARLVPIIRTYAPFVAGIAKMDFWLFLIYNTLGGILWITFFIYTSYFFGHIPIVKQNFSLIILMIIFISVIPLTVEFIRAYFGKKSAE